MGNVFELMKRFASDVLKAALSSGMSEDNGIRIVASTSTDEGTKPLLIVGNTHRYFNDGNCVAILNPDEALVDQIHAGVGYPPRILKEMVSGRCDAMLQLDLTAGNTRVFGRYRARRGRPATFVVR